MSVSIPQAEPSPPAEPNDRDGAIPLLENGDRLTADEFLRRYEVMPGLKKAELIEGVVHVPSPVRQKYHGAPHSTLIGWLFAYRARTPGVELGDSSTVHLGLTNTPQPDCLLFIQPEHGGRAKIDEEGYIVGAPTWSPRLPPAASATTCTTSATPTGAMASANISSGVCATGRSTGSYCAKAATSPSPPGLTAPCAARSFPDCGSTRPHSSAATWPRSWPSSSGVWTPPSTRRSRPNCNGPRPCRLVERRAGNGSLTNASERGQPRFPGARNWVAPAALQYDNLYNKIGLRGSSRLAVRADHVTEGFDEITLPLHVERPKMLAQLYTPDGEEGFGLCDAIPAQPKLPGSKWDAVRLLRNVPRTAWR